MLTTLCCARPTPGFRYTRRIVSTTDGRTHTQAEQAVFLIAGELRQRTQVLPRANHEYRLSTRLVADPSYSTDGFWIRLEAGGSVLAEKQFAKADAVAVSEIDPRSGSVEHAEGCVGLICAPCCTGLMCTLCCTGLMCTLCCTGLMCTLCSS